MDMRERIARAIAEFVGHHPWPVMAQHRADLRDKVRSGNDYDVNEPTQNDCLEAADAVLEALREPDEGMIEAGVAAMLAQERVANYGLVDPAHDVWRAMIDAARSPVGSASTPESDSQAATA